MPIENDGSERRTFTPSLSELALEDYLVQNLRDLDSSLTFEARQVRTDVGIIDILAKESTGMVIIELKAGEADDVAVAQVARYLGWMKQKEQSGDKFLRRRFRAILLASSFTDGARCAAAVIPDVTLYQFRLSRLLFSEVSTQ
jgi:RecB family endonuclease NucS